MSDMPHIQRHNTDCENCEYIIDIYFVGDTTHIWCKTNDGGTLHYPLAYRPKIYIAADQDADQYTGHNDRSIEEIHEIVKSHPKIVSTQLVKRFLSSSHDTETTVIEVEIYSPKAMSDVIGDLKSKNLNLFNIDLNIRQQFFLDTELSPMIACHIYVRQPHPLLDQAPDDAYILEDVTVHGDPTAIYYPIPPIRVMDVKTEINQKKTFANFSDELVSITIRTKIFGEEEPPDEKLKGTETQILLDFVDRIKEFDPDFLNVILGDKFVMNYLAHRAAANQITDQFILGRLDFPVYPRKEAKGQTYMSYGQIMRREAVWYLPGRVHIDAENSFFMHESGIAGLIDLARMSGVPPERTSRSSIGTALTGIEFKVNASTIPPTLVPPNKATGEQFKPADHLLISDNGGLIYPAVPGVYDRVWAIDFTSLYPFVMANHNIGNETVLCHHSSCKVDPILVPEVKYHLCKRRIGVVPRTMFLVLQKRILLKMSKKEAKDQVVRSRFAGIDSAMKWILVSCLTRTTRVLVRENSIIRSANIGEVVDQFNSNILTETIGINESGEPEWKKIKNVIKIPRNSPVYKLKFDGGKYVEATGDHLWPVITPSGWKTVRTDDLTPNDWIPQLQQIPQEIQYESVNLVTELLKTSEKKDLMKWRLKGPSIGFAVRSHLEQIERVALDDYTSQSVQNWWQSDLIPLKFWPIISEDVDVNDLLIGRGKIDGRLIQWLPAVLPLSRDLGYFLGFHLGDGSSGLTVRFDIGSDDKLLIEELVRIGNEYWQLKPKIYSEKGTKMVVVQFNSRALAFVVNNILGMKGTAIKRDLVIPKIVWNGPDALIEGFLSGYLAADGTIGKNRLYASFDTVQSSLARDIGFLCSRIGLSYRIDIEGEMSKVVLNNYNDILQLESYGVMSKKHQKKLRYHLENQQFFRSRDWPIENSGILQLAKSARKTRKPRVTKREAISKENLLSKIEQLEDKKGKLSEGELEILKRLKALSKKPIIFTQLKSIEKLQEQPEFVYCFELDSSTPWFMVQGGVLTHNCFGYLGFKNARWGSIESHQCVTAYARRYLMKARQISEEFGFEIIAGITDSLFIRAKDKKYDNRPHIEKLVMEISRACSIPVDVEGRFQWLVFGSVRDYHEVGALNRYFGYFDHGEFKLRGIKHRQRRAIKLELQFQEELLECFKSARTVEEFYSLIPKSYSILQRYIDDLENKRVLAPDLIMKLKSGKGAGGYKATSTVQALTVKRYEELGMRVYPGMNFFFVVVDDTRKDIERVRIGPEITEETDYDPSYYITLLNKDYLEITEDAQRGAYDYIMYSNEGVVRSLDEYDAEGVEAEFTLMQHPKKRKKKKEKQVSLDEYF